MRYFILCLTFLAILASPATATTARETFINSLPDTQDELRCRAKLVDIWTNASRTPLGAADDELKVRAVTPPENTRILHVRWLSTETAVAQCENPTHRYLAFFIKEDGKWSYARHCKMGPVKK